jgi:hypothetical protein
VCFSIVVGKVELECPFSFNIKPAINPVYSSFVVVETQVFKEMRGVGHAF